MRFSFVLAFALACQPTGSDSDSETETDLNDGSWDACPTPTDFTVSVNDDGVTFDWTGELSDLIVIAAGTDWELYDHLWAIQCGADYVADAYGEGEIPPNCIEPPLTYGEVGQHFDFGPAANLVPGESYDMYGAWWCNDGSDYAQFHIDGPHNFTR